MIKHCAWPTPAPVGPTWYWDQVSWDRWGERFRPTGYDGPIHDVEAYQQWIDARRWHVALWYISEDGERRFLWASVCDADSKDAAIRWAMEEGWEPRLETAGCTPVPIATLAVNLQKEKD